MRSIWNTFRTKQKVLLSLFILLLSLLFSTELRAQKAVVSLSFQDTTVEAIIHEIRNHQAKLWKRFWINV
jgi:hypothetical protein